MSQDILNVGNVVPLANRMILKLKFFGTEKWDCKLSTRHSFSYGTFLLTTTVTMLSITFFWGIESRACQSTSAAARLFMYFLVCDRCTRGKGLLWSQAARAEWCTRDMSALPGVVIQRIKWHPANQLPWLSASKVKQMGWISFLPLLQEDEAHTDENSPWQTTLRATGSKEHTRVNLTEGWLFSVLWF